MREISREATDDSRHDQGPGAMQLATNPPTPSTAKTTSGESKDELAALAREDKRASEDRSDPGSADRVHLGDD